MARGVCLFAKTLEDAQFCQIGPATLQLNHAQLLALVDGLDWKKVPTGGCKAAAIDGLKNLWHFKSGF